MSEVSQDIKVSRERVDVNKIKIVADAASFTGYSIVAMDKEHAGQPGLPASVFEVALYREVKRLEQENIKLRTFIDNVRRIGNETDYVFALDAVMEELGTLEMTKDSWAQTLSDLDMASSEDVVAEEGELESLRKIADLSAD